MTKSRNQRSTESLAPIKDLQTRLDRQCDPNTKAWFEAYLKGVIPYRGLKLPQVRSHLK
ncbi:hypothetical protein IQ266_26735 [filamentous cyanobacterium LEGE 11480]|uniref:Uncharacterized protein n=1 Tax=Romeriopsis navalis LEGE 11480 TaxID=2777977 RepID=A0A928Z7N7_9CYAN|nr:DNA alkylation repair protein [Romeriopsis navalis]MBE9033335.1 hypothetical protein [Romeriopsis navalis LEGE 11480]